MTTRPDWLPSLVFLEDYSGNWERYLNTLYDFFKQDFINSRPVFEGRRLGLKHHPLSQGKEATFWHLISQGDNEPERTVDIRRCERIRWPRPIIENSDDSTVKMWRNKRGTETRICLWLEAQEYLVILADRGRYILPWTAYVVNMPHRRRKLQKEFEQYWKNRSQKG